MVDEPREYRKLIIGLAAAALIAMLAGGCTGGASGKQASAPPARNLSATPPSTPDPEHQARAAIEAAFRAWSSDVTAANRDPNGSFDRLADHMTGNALKTMQVYIIDRRHHGLVARGTPRFGALRITSVTAKHAAAQTCIDSTKFVDYRGGQLVENSAGTVRSYHIGFTLATNWKVSTFTSKPADCVA